MTGSNSPQENNFIRYNSDELENGDNDDDLQK